MNIKAAYRYQVSDHIKAMIIFYFIISIVLLLLFFSFDITTSAGEGITSAQLGGLEMATIIFLFVAGIDGFKEVFGMLMQNGMSRKTLFISRLYTSVTISFIMAIVNTFFLLFFKALSSIVSSVYCTSLYEQIYMENTTNNSSFSFYLLNLLYNFFVYLCFIAIGYLIRLIYYRLNKLGTIIISISVPVGFLLVIPIFDANVTGGKIGGTISELFDIAFGVSSKHSINAMISYTVLFTIISGFSWLLMRKSIVTE